MTFILYACIHTETYRKYYGITSRTIEIRRKEHEKIAKSNKGYHLHNALRLYGVNNFQWVEIRSFISKAEVCYFEQLYIECDDTTNENYGFNISIGGEHTTMTDVIRRKISVARKAYLSIDKHRKELSNARKGKLNPMFGKSLSKEHKKKISAGVSGKKNGLYGKRGADHPFWGMSNRQPSPSSGKTWTLSDKTKLKQSISKCGKNNPNFNKTTSEETKKKLSDALKLHHRNKNKI